MILDIEKARDEAARIRLGEQEFYRLLEAQAAAEALNAATRVLREAP